MDALSETVTNEYSGGQEPGTALPAGAVARLSMLDELSDDSLLRVVRAHCSAQVEPAWSLLEPDSLSGMGWIHLHRAGSAVRTQGWKLHVSATVRSATMVLERVLPILLAENVTFKVASSLGALHGLNHELGGSSQVGKFITIYPESDAQAVALAIALDSATRKLEGPAIPSDRALRPGSLVHYRYGGFDDRRIQTSLGEIVPAMSTPDGTLVPDRRTTSYQAPDWASDPFAEAGLGDAPAALRWVGGKYLLLSLLHTSPRGPLYIALDFQNSRTCVIKGASRGAVCTLDGFDAMKRLRNEALILQTLAPDPRFPAYYDLVEQEGRLFLAMEDVEGETLAAHMRTLSLRGEYVPQPKLVKWGRELAALLQSVHEHGLIYRDLKPTNVILTPGGSMRLIDLELCYRPETDKVMFAPGIGTQGYMSPQQASGSRATMADDIYSMGALLYFLATGVEPSGSPRAYDLLCRPIEALNPLSNPALTEVIACCLAASREERYENMESLGLALASIENSVITDKVAGQPMATGAADQAEATAEATSEKQYRDMARKLGDAICVGAQNTPSGTGVTWLSQHAAAHNSEARDINLGTSGIILALCEVVAEIGDQRHRDILEAAARHLCRTTGIASPPLPGLYVGEAGVGLALLRAGQVLGHADLVSEALEKGRSIAKAPHGSPDLFNGTAGRLQFHLRLWNATRRQDQLDFAIEAGEYLLASAQSPAPVELMWTIPAGYDGLSGNTFLGYAHGAAGIADVLLELYGATEDEKWLDAACMAGNWLAKQAVPILADGSGLSWPNVPGSTLAAPFWCHGSAGIGRFFMHLTEAHALEGASEIAHGAALAVANAGLWAGPTQCHGLSGNIEFLLDMFQSTGDHAHLAAAHKLARLLEAFAVERNGVTVWPSDTPETYTPDYMVGYSGVATCLLRLSAPARLGNIFEAFRPQIASKIAYHGYVAPCPSEKRPRRYCDAGRDL